MNKVIHPHSFQAADLHSAADQAGAAVVDGSAAPVPFPRRKPIIAGYDSLDISFAQNAIAILTRDYLLAVKECLENNEHVESFASREDFKNVVLDAVGDHLIGPLQNALDELEGNR